MSQLVMIVTPAYNVAIFITRAIESVIAQTYPRYEFTIVNFWMPLP